MLGTVAHQAHGLPAMGQHPDRFDGVLPDADPKAVQPRQGHETKKSLQPLGVCDASALQVEAPGLVAAKHAFHGPPELVKVPRFPDAEIRGDDDEIPQRGSRGDHLLARTASVLSRTAPSRRLLA